jgi:hypothetical protein
MNTLEIPINGRPQPINIEFIDINRLILDELNPRISFFRDNQPKSNLNREEIIFALTQKRPEAFRKLKDSIENNRGIISPIWVEPKEENCFRVIEGNSRVVAYTQLLLDQPYEETWKKIMSYVLPEKISEEELNFIRLLAHLRGTNEWDAYEKAKYLFKLWKEEGWSIKRLEKQTKMSEKEIENSIKAYEIMEEQYLPQHYDDPSETSKFSYFVEYVRDKKLQNSLQKNSLGVNDFITWVSDDVMIPTGQDVRLLKDIIDNNETRGVYINKGFESARQILELKKPYLISPLFRDIESTIEGLKSISSFELDEIIGDKDGEKQKMIYELQTWTLKVLKIINGDEDGKFET